MRVSLVTETYPPEINGVALTVQSLAHGLRDLGHEVSVVRPRQGDAVESSPGISELLVPGAALPRYPGLRFGMPVIGRLRSFWKLQKPDAIYVATEGPLGWAAVRAARQLSLPAATGFHTRFDDYFNHYGMKFLTPVVFAWLRRFHNAAQATIVPTRELQDFLTDNGFRNVRRMGRSVDMQRFDPARRDDALRAQWGLAPDDVAVIYVGRVAPEKNLDLAVRTFRSLQQQHPQAKFIWVGDGPVRPVLAEQNPDFIFAGMRHGDDLGRHYASADLFLFPSLSETFGNVTLEAMASGLATIAFDYGAAREYITSPILGRAVACDNANAFTAAALALADDAHLRRAMGTRAREALLAANQTPIAGQFAQLLAGLRFREAA